MVTYVDIRRPQGGVSRSLKRHLALGLGLFTLLLSAGLSFLVEHLAAESSIRQIGIQLASRAAETRDRVDIGVYERLRDVLVLADFATSAGGSALRRAQLEDLQRRRPAFAWAAHADASGRVLAATQGRMEGADVSRRSWFKRGLQGPVVEDPQRDDALPRQPGRAEGEPMRFVPLAAPVRNPAGQALGVLVVYLDMDALRDPRQTLAGNTTLFILSRNGTVLHGIQALEGSKLELRSVAEATPARSVWHEERWPDGDRYITAASVTRGHPDYPGLGWAVVLRQDPGEALAEVTQMQLQIIATGVLVGIVFAGLAWWFADRVARPLTSISEAADRLGAGERDLSIPAVSGYAEVERLAASLRAMLSKLRRHEEDLLQTRDKLDLRVRERSAELARTRVDLEATMVEREHARRELAREKERLDLALDAAQVAVWTYDLASGRIELSEQWSAMLGGARGITTSSVEEMISLVPEAERGSVREAMSAAARGLRPSYIVRHRVQRANGELLLTESRGRIVERGPDGAAVRIAGTVRAIAEG
jgi:diguanylate cyclase